MRSSSRQPIDQSDSRLRLQTIVRLRWFAVLGQTIAVAVVALWLKFPMPVGYCLVFIT
ncbi:MAG: sensor histidine kinase, partial [Hyphomicrobiaceae bacterium]